MDPRNNVKSQRFSMKVFLQDPDYYVDIKDITIGPSLGAGAFSNVYSKYFFMLDARLFSFTLWLFIVGRYFGDLVAVKKQVRDAEVRTLNIFKSLHCDANITMTYYI